MYDAHLVSDAASWPAELSAVDPAFLRRRYRQRTPTALPYPVGGDAHRWINGRQRITDEEWVDFGRKMPDTELAALYHKYFGMEL